MTERNFVREDPNNSKGREATALPLLRGHESTNSALLEKAKKDGIDRISTAGLVRREDGRVLIIRRKLGDTVGGLYEAPGGGFGDDGTLEESLSRETSEEIGLRIRAVKEYLGHVDFNDKHGLKCRKFLFAIDVEDGEPKLSDEHVEYKWVDRNEIKEYNLTPDMGKLLLSKV